MHAGRHRFHGCRFTQQGGDTVNAMLDQMLIEIS
jgi:hypothetical protein